MEATQRSDADKVATYEICLRGSVPESLGNLSTGRTDPTQTVLFRRVRDVGELDALLERLRSSGLVLIDIHGAPPPERRSATFRYYEVRVRGELGAKLLEYLGWSHRTITQRQVSARDLDAFLAQCAEAGLVVDQLRKTS
jgi:hypothetical protein